MFKNYTTPKGKKGKSFILTKDPNQLRDVNAKFDPKQKNSANLLASGVIGALGMQTINEDESI